jgi:MoaA/NifB/PqqE/SkfB family radical SAM enzyme
MRVDLSGGEPTLRRDIGHIATSALDAGLNVVVSTNGSVLASPIEKFNRNVRIHVSLDSGFSEVHERSRILPGGMPSSGSFDRVSRFIARAVSEGFRVRVITCVGKHNAEGLFRLGEHLASLRVREWNVSRVLAAGRAQTHYADHWRVVDRAVTDQIHDMRKAYPFIRIRFSSRVADEGYFLLVLNDGTVATQYTNGRDKVRLGNIHDLSVEALRSHPLFRFDLHARKWLAAIRERYDSVA